ncbi:MAG TPA: hypothetical protein VD902_05005, partial [Symbiobacteriaceae bacterium]|nr:hypothetical protein [Symbiobacteriaceae bacterium]
AVQDGKLTREEADQMLNGPGPFGQGGRGPQAMNGGRRGGFGQGPGAMGPGPGAGGPGAMGRGSGAGGPGAGGRGGAFWQSESN